MSALSPFDAGIQAIRGSIGATWGQMFDVFRLSANSSSSGIVTSASMIASNVGVLFRRETSRKEIEVESSVRSIASLGELDATTFQECDVFVQRSDSYHYENAVYTLASRRPAPRQSIFIATPVYAQFSRPESNPEHIDSGRVPQSVPLKEYEWPLTLSGGYYSFQRTGTSATVPVSMIMERQRDYPRTDTSLGQLWDDTRRQTWDVFVPLGPPLITRDILTGANGDRYEVTGVQISTTSFKGQLVTVQRIRS